MTQLVNKASSWRTLRHKVVVGASSIALVAGMGVALAPAASAATPPKITVDLPDTIQNNNDDTSWSIKVANPADGATLTDVTGKITVTLPAGLNCGAVTPNGLGLGLAGAGDPGFQAVGNLSAPDNTKLNVCEADVAVTTDGTDNTNNKKLVLPGADFTSASTTLKINGGAFTGVTGEITVAFALYQASSTAPFATGSDTAALVAPAVPTMTTGTVPVPQAGFSYSYKIVANAGTPKATVGLPANPGDPGYKVLGRHYNADANSYSSSTTATIVGAGLANVATANKGQVIWNSADKVFYLPSSGPATPAVSAVEDDYAFTFNPATGRVQSVGAVATNAAQYWTWTITANNGQGSFAGSSAYQLIPQLEAKDVASGQFTLSTAAADVSFSDYSKTSVFGTEVWTLAEAGIIRGYDDGTFGPNKPVTRQAFAAYVVRTVEALTGTAINQGKCTSGSSFADVNQFSQFCEEIKWLEARGITQGYDNGKNFKPAQAITREAIAAMLYRVDSLITAAGGSITLNSGVAAALPQCTMASSFADVSQDNPFCGAIEWAANTDPAITTGTKVDDTTSNFKPKDATSRQAASTFFYRLANVEYAAANPTATDTFWG